MGILVQNFSTIGCGIVIAFIYQWKLTLVVLAVSPLVAFANFMQMYAAKGFQLKREKATTRANTVAGVFLSHSFPHSPHSSRSHSGSSFSFSLLCAGDSISSIRTVAAFTNEQKVLEKYHMSLKGPVRMGVKAGQISAFLLGIGQFLMFGCNTVGFVYGGKLIKDQEADFLDVMTVFMCIIMSATSVGQSASFIPNANKAKAAANSIFKIIDSVPHIDSASDAGEKLSEIRGDVEFRDVRFTYPERLEAPVFNGLNLKIKKGSVVALVGPSGSGKSTCIQLMERFYDPDQGTVIVVTFVVTVVTDFFFSSNRCGTVRRQRLAKVEHQVVATTGTFLLIT